MKPDQTINELLIIKKMKEGNINSFKYFFSIYYSDLCNFANTYLHDRDLSEELVEDIFVWFWQSRETLEINKSVKAFLFTVTKLRSLNMVRSLRIHRKIETDISSACSWISENEGEKVIESELILKLVNDAVARLSPKCREIYILSKHEELSNKEIAQQLDISVKTVEAQMTIASKKIKDHLIRYRNELFTLLP